MIDKDEIMRIAHIVMTIGSSCLAIIFAVTESKREQEAIEKAVKKYLESK